MIPTRRECLGRAASLALASGSLGIAASCSTSPRVKSIAQVAILSPMTGERAHIGEAMERAVRLVRQPEMTLRVFDTRSTAEGVQALAKDISAFRPDVIIGPASSDEARALQVDAPVLTLSNDEALQSHGQFVLGVTATQSVGALFAYARGAGVRTVGVIRAQTAWSARCEAAALEKSGPADLRIAGIIDQPPGDVVEALRTATGGELPNAVLLADAGPDFVRIAAELRTSTIQVLGTSQWSASDMTAFSAQGAWIAAPDPKTSARFADAYSRAYGEVPGFLAGLAYDAMLAATTLAIANRLSRTGLVQSEGFNGVTGMFRFTVDGMSKRRLPILVASPKGLQVAEQVITPWS